jgi:hypothetical protein
MDAARAIAGLIALLLPMQTGALRERVRMPARAASVDLNGSRCSRRDCCLGTIPHVRPAEPQADGKMLATFQTCGLSHAKRLAEIAAVSPKRQPKNLTRISQSDAVGD